MNNTDIFNTAISIAKEHITTKKRGSLVTSKETLPIELWKILQGLKLTKDYGKALSKAISFENIGLERASGSNALTSNRHNQYIVL